MNMAIEAYTFIFCLNPNLCILPLQPIIPQSPVSSRRRRPNLGFFPRVRLSRPTVTLFHHDHLRDVETPFHVDTAFGHTPLRIVLRPGFADFAGDD